MKYVFKNINGMMNDYSEFWVVNVDRSTVRIFYINIFDIDKNNFLKENAFSEFLVVQ